jgi:hypothetical protein
MMKNIKIFDINGNESNLYDASDDNGNLKDEFLTEENIKDWLSTSSFESALESNKFLNTVNKITQVNKIIHANYDPKSPLKANEKVAYQAFIQFRKWMFEGIAQRFQGEKGDFYLSRKVRGRYRTYGDVFAFEKSQNSSESMLAKNTMATLNVAKRVMNGLIFRKEAAVGDLTAENGFENYTQPNMMKNIAGARFTILLTLLLSAMKNFNDDEEEKNNPLYSFLMNQGYRLNQDINFFNSPASGRGILGSVIPSARIFESYGRFFDAGQKYLFEDDPYFRQGPFKDMNRLGVRFGQLIPGSNAALSAYKQSKEIYQAFK